MLTIDSQRPKSDSQSLISTPIRPKLIRRQIYPIWDFQIWDHIQFLPPWILDKRQKGKDKRQKGKFTPSETSRSEIRYYFYPLDKRQEGKKTNLLHLRPPDLDLGLDTILNPRTKGKKANLLNLRPSDLRVYTIFSPLDKRWKDKKVNLLHLRPPDMRSGTILTTLDKRQKGKRQIYSTWHLQIWDQILFLPPGKKAKRQKGKFTPYKTPRSEIRYYFYPPGQKAKNANLLHLRPLHLRLDTIFTPWTKGKKAKRQIYSI